MRASGLPYIREVPPATPLPWSPWREAFGSSGGLIWVGQGITRAQ